MKKWTADQIKMVVFDVDGTLYSQHTLRPKMMLDLLQYYAVRPFRINELLVLYHFRKEREKNALAGKKNISENQYLWCQQKVNVSLEEIKAVVDKWLVNRPLKYLSHCIYGQAVEFIDGIKKKGIKTAVYSDYNADKKLSAMNLKVDYIFSSEQKEIDELKPSPKGLNFIASHLDMEKEHILYIGDREEFDGACAASAGMSHLILDQKTANTFYEKLKHEFDLGE